ncbi:MAG: ABC-F family ATP-binding cassette domain-containing protein [Eubacterium sp.]|nr:ABC-F family ATP-binding cassette domain-containing protein [Eubacterium sp.]
MNLLNFEHVGKSFLNKVVLSDVSFGMEDTDKLGVVGVNGTGKSTLLAIAAGALEADQGQVVKGRQVTISYLPQKPEFDDSMTLLENVAMKINGKASHWNTEGEVKARLADFGLPDPDIRPSLLSGGQRKRAALIAAVLTPCDLLILDEPTNHLDSRMIEWLESYLRSFRGAILMITHDRYFLDSVTNGIVELDKGSAYRYDANFSGYLEMKAQRQDYARAAERKMAALYRQDLAWMMRGARARSTKQKAHIQRFEALKNRDRIVEDRQMALNSLPSRLGKKTIELDRIAAAVKIKDPVHTGQETERVLFRDFTYHFLKTDRIGVIGPNGCGKTTLLRLITGQRQPDEGRVEIGTTVKIGYFSQENEELDLNERVIDAVRDIAEFIPTADGPVSASNMCEQFLFDGNMQYNLIGKLSGGEKRRLSLLKVLMGAPNVLVLDEPTNDLDIETLEILEDYLDRFPGIVIAVSHDRYFLDRVVTRIFAFEEGGSISQSEGGYEDYLRHCRDRGREPYAGQGNGSTAAERKNGKKTAEAELLKDLQNKDAAASYKEAAADYRKSRKKTKFSFREQQEYDTIEEEIERLEQLSAALEKQMEKAATDYVKLQELTEQKTETDRQIEEKMERYYELEDMKASFDQPS